MSNSLTLAVGGVGKREEQQIQIIHIINRKDNSNHDNAFN